MNRITKFFHEFMNPHCTHCANERIQELEQKELDREINLVCNSCESLKMQLSIANNRVDNLIEKLTNTTRIEEAPVNSTEPAKILQTRQHVPWAVKRQQLELQSKERAVQLKNLAKPDSEINESIEKLEDKLGIENAGNSAEAINS
jgi:hypothetical protein